MEARTQEPRRRGARCHAGHPGPDRRRAQGRHARQGPAARPPARQPDQRLRSCIDGGVKHAKQAGESDERLFTVSAWREAPYFSDAERAALALAEAMTRLDDRADPVPDEIWEEAKKHFDERALSGLVLWIATTNFFNRLNVTTRQPAGQAW